MGPNSLPPLDVPKKSISLWLVVAVVFIAGLGAGVLIPAGLKIFGLNDSKVASNKREPLTMQMPNGKLRRVDPPLSNKPTAPVATEIKVAKTEKVQKPKQKLAAAAFPAPKKEKAQIAKIEKTAPVKDKVSAPKAVAVAKAVKAPAPAAPSADLIEEVPSALTAVQVEKLMQKNSVVMARNQKALARPVSLPPSQALNPNSNLGQSMAALPILKSDPRGENKTYPLSINNASFSKATLTSCSKRCALFGMDAMGNPIKAIIDGPTYAASLIQHNGTINISGQPRIVKNQQVLVVENITFNLAPTQKAVAKRGRSAAATLPVAVEEKASGYTEVSFEGDDLKPGTVIKNRKQIPIEHQQEIPAP